MSWWQEAKISIKNQLSLCPVEFGGVSTLDTVYSVYDFSTFSDARSFSLIWFSIPFWICPYLFWYALIELLLYLLIERLLLHRPFHKFFSTLSFHLATYQLSYIQISWLHHPFTKNKTTGSIYVSILPLASVQNCVPKLISNIICTTASMKLGISITSGKHVKLLT